MQNEPDYRVIVALTQDGEETIHSYGQDIRKESLLCGSQRLERVHFSVQFSEVSNVSECIQN